MNFTREELLQPSLSNLRIAKAPYSVRTMFVTSFFGGPFAAIAIVAVNSVRLLRWKRDLAPLVLLFAATGGFFAALQLTPWGQGFVAYLTSLVGRSSLSYISRILGLIIFGIGYWLHRKEQRSADFMGLARPNGWIGGLACFVIGIGIVFAVAISLDHADIP